METRTERSTPLLLRTPNPIAYAFAMIAVCLLAQRCGF